MLGAAAGAFVVIALVAFIASIDSDDPQVPGVVLSLFLTLVALGVGLRGPGPLRSACVTVLVLTVPLLWVFALVGDGGGRRAAKCGASCCSRCSATAASTCSRGRRGAPSSSPAR